MNHQKNNPLLWGQLAVLVGVALYLTWQIVAPFIEVLVLATMMAVVFQPVQNKIKKHVASPSISAALTLLIVFLTILIPLAITVASLVPQLTDIIEKVQGKAQVFIEHPERTQRIQFWLESLSARLHLNFAEVMARIRTALGDFGKVVLQKTLAFVGGTIGMGINAFFVIFALFYLLRDGKMFAGKLADYLPLNDTESWNLIERARLMIVASVNGVLVIALVQGILGGVMFTILGIPSSLVWGLLMIFLAIIPVAGATIVWLPAAIILAASGQWVRAAILVAWSSLVIGTIDNFLRPKLVSGKTKMHELVVFFSVLGGLQVFGLLGFLLGPTIVSVTMALMSVVKEARKEA